ncbi:MAG TPA: XRE family transcriptional regulator [Syntrophales bacterium]|nr:XRE family transcriptional regulator [Syntrophales bacterium]
MTQNEDKNTAIEGLRIGRTVKEFRHKKHITLQDLAARTGIPKSVLAEIENGDVVPPVATLLKLAKAFNVGMASFFEEEAPGMKISVTRSGERIRIKRRPHHHEGEVDYIYESLETHKADKHMEPLLVEFQPLDTGDMVFTNHEGEEFIFVLEGRLEFRTDDRMEILESGDTLYFESDINHAFRSLDEKPARAIAVVWNKV